MSRSFHRDAARLMRFQRPLTVLGGENIPAGGPCLITANHYSSPSLRSWWLAIGISALVPVEIHWVVTNAWRDSGWKSAFSRWSFPRGARLYGFTPMPAMPPCPQEAEQRAAAVREVLSYARSHPAPLVGLAPEGRDFPGCILGQPPPGAGRFLLLLSQACRCILPVGVYEEEGGWRLSFGAPYRLQVPAGLAAEERDRLAGSLVMRHIARQLPGYLRGEFTDEEAERDGN